MQSENGQKPCILYARYSPKPEDSSKPIELQHLLCRRYLDVLERPVLAQYEDPGKSGRSRDDRPGLARALKHVCRVRGVLVVYKLDRLTRNLRDLLDISDEIQRAGADLASVTEQFDTSTPHGKLAFHLLGAISEFIRAQGAHRTREAMRQMMRDGRTAGGIPPYGWEFDPSSPVLEGHTAPSRIRKCAREQQIIAQILRLHSAGYCYSAICTALTNSGIEPRQGRWSHKTIGRVIRRAEDTSR